MAAAAGEHAECCVTNYWGKPCCDTMDTMYETYETGEDYVDEDYYENGEYEKDIFLHRCCQTP